MIIEQMQRGIRIALAKRGLKIAEAAYKADVAASTIHRFMTNETDIKLVTLAQFCRNGLDYSFESVLKMGKAE